MKNNRLTLWLIILLTVFAVWVNAPSTSGLPDNTQILGQKLNLGWLKTNHWELNIAGKRLNLSGILPANLFGHFPIKLGLDLRGGTEMVLKTQMDKIPAGDRDTALESAKEVIERRVNFFGVSESVVRTSKLGEDRRIIIELPGVSDLDEASRLVGQTAQLDFREEIASPSAEASGSAQVLLNFDDYKPTGLTGADLKKAQVVFNNTGTRATKSSAQIELQFTDEGAKKFAEITKRNVGKPLGIFLDGFPTTWPPPVVQQEILGGSAVISGSFTTEEAKNLAIQLNAGALPVPIEILSQRQVAPTLGETFVQKSLIAGVVGMLAVMLYMVGIYGRLGLIANLALIFYTLFTLAVFRSGIFILPKVTLTLAGIAGFILSVGMAVDANILTFERVKEELRSGKSPRNALETGFKRAWTSIRDSNISSLITAGILYYFGTSVVKGFALTLALGVLISMFSAIIVTRTFLRYLPRFRK